MNLNYFVLKILTMLKLKTTNRFEKDYRRALKSGKDMKKLKQVMDWLAQEQPLPPKNRDHKLIGKYEARRECHVAPDWLLIYKIEVDTIIFERTGSHSELFKK